MAVRKTVLELVDFPFAYSILTMILLNYEKISSFEQIAIIGLISGLIGTFLVITDPIGRIFGFLL